MTPGNFFMLSAYMFAGILSFGVGLQEGLGVGLAWFGALALTITLFVSMIKYLSGDFE
jgi:hypothetical protein